MKKLLILYVLFLILAGCSTKQSPVEKQESNVGHKDVELKKNVKYPTSQNKPLQSPNPSVQEKVILNVPLISQKPELKYGCEVTSLAMVLQHAGIKVNKIQLANSIKKDNDPLFMNKSGDIIQWGDPKEGFVGDITGKNKGYAVYVQPLQELMERYLPNRTVNLTGKAFNDVLAQIKMDKPVVIWTTGDYKVPDRWESWKHGNKQITAPLDLHAVVLIGFEDGYIYINDPLSEKKAHKVNQKTFIQSWNALGKQALSYR
ncbi:C39 family peptidase [Bacillus pseudomycoides]|uniref:C39 family peptidase n=1 Tax=Bacillus pseudomycoides TaxID=64104 RepID=UPI0023D99CB2|nr:C39 family peptidase [Bacillus pseudomycoides]MDF2085666.1 C39 family peptidase [Bacillus pseudomycoides]